MLSNVDLFTAMRNAMKVRVAICSIIYRKVCVLQLTFGNNWNFLFGFACQTVTAIVEYGVRRDGTGQSGQFAIERCGSLRLCLDAVEHNVDGTVANDHCGHFVVARNRALRSNWHIDCVYCCSTTM